MAGSKAPANETPAQRFVRLANIRAGNALTAIEGLGKLVGPSYTSTAEQHAKLMGALADKLTEAKASLASNKTSVRAKSGVL